MLNMKLSQTPIGPPVAQPGILKCKIELFVAMFEFFIVGVYV